MTTTVNTLTADTGAFIFQKTNAKGKTKTITVEGVAGAVMASSADRLTAGQLDMKRKVRAGAWSPVFSTLALLPAKTLASALSIARSDAACFLHHLAEQAESPHAAIATVKRAGSVLTVPQGATMPTVVSAIEAAAFIRAVSRLDPTAKGKTGNARGLAQAAYEGLSELVAMPQALGELRQYFSWASEQAPAQSE